MLQPTWQPQSQVLNLMLHSVDSVPSRQRIKQHCNPISVFRHESIFSVGTCLSISPFLRKQWMDRSYMNVALMAYIYHLLALFNTFSCSSVANTKCLVPSTLTSFSKMLSGVYSLSVNSRFTKSFRCFFCVCRLVIPIKLSDLEWYTDW